MSSSWLMSTCRAAWGLRQKWQLEGFPRCSQPGLHAAAPAPQSPYCAAGLIPNPEPPCFCFSPVSLSAVAHSRQLFHTLSSTSELLFSGSAWAWQPHTGTGSLRHNSSTSRGSWRAAMPALPLPDSLRALRTVWLHPTRNCLESRVLSNSISDATAGSIHPTLAAFCPPKLLIPTLLMGEVIFSQVPFPELA